MDHATPPTRPRQTSYYVFSSSNSIRISTSSSSASSSSSKSHNDSSGHADSTAVGPRNVDCEIDSGREILIRTTQSPQALQDAMGSPLPPSPWGASLPSCSPTAHAIIGSVNSGTKSKSIRGCSSYSSPAVAAVAAVADANAGVAAAADDDAGAAAAATAGAGAAAVDADDTDADGGIDGTNIANGSRPPRQRKRSRPWSESPAEPVSNGRAPHGPMRGSGADHGPMSGSRADRGPMSDGEDDHEPRSYDRAEHISLIGGKANHRPMRVDSRHGGRRSMTSDEANATDRSGKGDGGGEGMADCASVAVPMAGGWAGDDMLSLSGGVGDGDGSRRGGELRTAKRESRDGTVTGNDRSARSSSSRRQQQHQQRQRQQEQEPEQTVRVAVNELLSEDFGLFTWPSGVVLACLVWARRREFRGLSVVEIGGGTALPGLLAAKLGARVVLTDREDAPWVLDNMREAVAANGLVGPADETPPLTFGGGGDCGGGCGGGSVGGGGGNDGGDDYDGKGDAASANAAADMAASAAAAKTNDDVNAPAASEPRHEQGRAGKSERGAGSAGSGGGGGGDGDGDGKGDAAAADAVADAAASAAAAKTNADVTASAASEPRHKQDRAGNSGRGTGSAGGGGGAGGDGDGDGDAAAADAAGGTTACAAAAKTDADVAASAAAGPRRKEEEAGKSENGNGSMKGRGHRNVNVTSTALPHANASSSHCSGFRSGCSSASASDAASETIRAGVSVRDTRGEGGVGGGGERGGGACPPGEKEGTCTVSGLSWGSVTPSAIKLVTEQWRPQVVLGADVFYSSEHFDSVLATVFLLLSPPSVVTPSCNGRGGSGGGSSSSSSSSSSTGCVGDCDGSSGGGSDSGGDGAVDVGGVGHGCGGVGSGGGGVGSGGDGGVGSGGGRGGSGVDGSVGGGNDSEGSGGSGGSGVGGGDSWEGGGGGVCGRYGGSGGGDGAVGGRGSGSSGRKPVFLTAYHERSARRSLRPLLRKWGMRAEVLHGVPQQVLPAALWESGRYDSVALLEITLR